MNARVLILPLIVLTACSGQRGCSQIDRTAGGSPEPLPPTPASTPVATPDPLAGRRAELVARINALSDSECDALVLRFELIPRDEILEPLSKPRNELLRYVKRIAARED